VLKIGADDNLVRLNSSAVADPGGVLTADTGIGCVRPIGPRRIRLAEASGIERAQYLAHVQVTINGVPGQVHYAGPAPGFAGLSQINVLVPQTTAGPVKILINNVQFPQVVQVWLR
jgi:uncharacterized protein (TIGR03437 family)